jgi:hypothetical protein
MRIGGATLITDSWHGGRRTVAVGGGRSTAPTSMLTDSVAIIPGPRVIPQSGETVNAFFLDEHGARKPEIALNVEFTIAESSRSAPAAVGSGSSDSQSICGDTQLRQARHGRRSACRKRHAAHPRGGGASPVRRSALDYQLVEEEDDRASRA